MCCEAILTYTYCIHQATGFFMSCSAAQKTKGTKRMKGRKKACGEWGPHIKVPTGQDFCHDCVMEIQNYRLLDEEMKQRQCKILAEVRETLENDPELDQFLYAAAAKQAHAKN